MSEGKNNARLDRMALLKGGLESFLERLLADGPLFAPAKDAYRFEEVSSPGEVDLRLPNTVVPPKELFLPVSRRLFSYRPKGNGVEVSPEVGETVHRTVIGVRACDVASLSMLDAVLLSDPADELYMSERERTLVIAVPCGRGDYGCFCSSMGVDPRDPSGADIVLSGDDSGGWLVDVQSDKGCVVAGGYEELFDRAGVVDEEMERPLLRRSLDPSGALETLEKGGGREVFEALAERCLECGLCTFLCPTCYCFDLSEKLKSVVVPSGERMRGWDTCQLSEFTRMAGGANPRGDRVDRLAQRVLHKLLYFPLSHGMVACTGCGRCLRACPVNIDMFQAALALEGGGAGA